MKTKSEEMRRGVRLAILAGGILGLCFQPRLALAQGGSSGEGGCDECLSYGPYIELYGGSLINSPSITPVDFCQIYGTSPIVPTNVVFPVYSDGQEYRWVEYWCPTPGMSNQYNSISYTAGSLLYATNWPPTPYNLPASLTNSLTATAYVIMQSSDSNVCPNIPYNYGSVNWCVATISTNCTNAGCISLSNTSASSNFCFGSPLILSVTTNSTNALVAFTTNCPCGDSLDGTLTTNVPPSILSTMAVRDSPRGLHKPRERVIDIEYAKRPWQRNGHLLCELHRVHQFRAV